MASKQFKVDARAVLSFGRDSIKDHVTAVIELVKNSYDAGAKVAEIEVAVKNADPKKHFIRIADNGDGMNESDVEKKWLRIGFSEKLAEKKIGKRRRLGEKGVGRLSADRLGEMLQLSAQAKEDTPVGIKVNWADFETAGKDIGAVDIELLDAVSFDVPQPSIWDAEEKAFGPRPDSVPNSGKHSGCELKIAHESVNVLVADQVLSDNSRHQAVNYQGHEVIQEVRRHLPDMPVYMITAFKDNADVEANLGRMEEMVPRGKLGAQAPVLVERMKRAGETFERRYRDSLSRLSELSRKKATEALSKPETEELQALQEAMALADTSDSRARLLPELEQHLGKLAELQAKAERLLRSKRGTR